jgi:drug/metabolite transporter (DMT)-like permease
LPVQSIPFVLLLGFVYGSTLVISRFSVGQFYPLTYVGIRLLLASIAYAMFYVSGRREFPKDRNLWVHASILGIFGSAIPISGIVSSTQYLSSGVVSVLITSDPALAVLMAHFFLPDEHLNWRKGLGITLALGGALLITLRGETGLPDVSQANPIGYVLVFGAMLSGSIMLVYSRKFMTGFRTFDVTSIRMLVAACVVMPLSIAIGGLDFSRVNQQGVTALLYASLIGTFIGILLEFYIVKRFGATAGAMPAYVIPIVATIGGVLLLGETITSGVVLGFVLVIAGLVLINRI